MSMSKSTSFSFSFSSRMLYKNELEKIDKLSMSYFNIYKISHVYENTQIWDDKKNSYE
jgi:hypothetical protein